MAKLDPNVIVHETVKIVNEAKKGEFIVIAAKDFDEAKHKLWELVEKAAKIVETDAEKIARLAAEKLKENPNDISKMNVPQMREYAKTNAIDLGNAQSKADITAIIVKWQADNKVGE